MKQRDLLFLSISTFVLIIAWVGFSIYHNSVASTISEKVAEKIAPINPTFDTKIINLIKERDAIVPLWEGREASESSLTPPEEPATNPDQEQAGETP
ncbi:MAG: hypothetical protein A2958_00950 [Candidatus Levybacteria bacterium RIFCSPLOWO2_01_FULL_38_13]|nr:MAG: hypothetical protein A2629_00845 [Candidatus Levybacteria bacterium RIFCSPHIGHO2_01_FULL_41_15]OGH34855.1 MAG: hypothetical protein A2958_00950 [Candidatus Levybacteria bacterium RIFCSPLOWO2_01_FULL_38_13]